LKSPEFVVLLKTCDELGVYGYDEYFQQYFLHNHDEWIRQNLLYLEKFTVKKGTYIAETLSDWRGREHVFGETFQKLCADPRLDPKGYCVEDYHHNGDVTCMVRINK
jgi:hypothetical protein